MCKLVAGLLPVVELPLHNFEALFIVGRPLLQLRGLTPGLLNHLRARRCGRNLAGFAVGVLCLALFRIDRGSDSTVVDVREKAGQRRLCVQRLEQFVGILAGRVRLRQVVRTLHLVQGFDLLLKIDEPLQSF
jgi:hypothetical protein